MEIFKNEYMKLVFNQDDSILEQIWFSNSLNMKTNDYKNLQEKTVVAFNENRAAKMFVDIKDFQFPIDPKLQVWTNELVIKKLIESKLQKIAYVVSLDIFSQISVEQAIDEEREHEFPARFFDSEKSAKDWLLTN